MSRYQDLQYANDTSCLQMGVKKVKQGDRVWNVTHKVKLPHETKTGRVLINNFWD